MSTFEDSILRVMNGDSVVGAAFLVSDRLVATCAHVVKSAGAKVGGNISLRFSGGEEVEAIVEPEFWRDPNAEDVSILRLDEPIDNIQPVTLGSSTGTKGHKFSTFGFPNKGQEISGGGEIIGQATIEGIKVLQLRSPEVTPGFSGAPIFDETTKRIVGMVVAIIPPDEYQRLGTTAFAIPSETIREICTELQIADICPYRSLDVFNEEDAPFFFGRERVVQKMIDCLKREPRFLAVLGPSGSGKSSVVRAGLIPALKQGKVPGSDKWGVILIRPTNQPFEQLDSAGLSKSQDGLEGAVHTWLEDHTEKTRLILIVDQFEEGLVSTSEDIRQKFIDELAHLLNSPVAITFVLTLRDDFYSRFLKDAAILTTWLERGLVNIPTTLDEDELRAIVIEPANVVGLSFEEGLVDVILNDASEADRTKGIARSTVLPLLEFALTQLWERRQQGMLTHDAYNAIGGVTGGLTQWADQAYYNLTPEEREIARHLLSELVRPGNEEQGIPDTRRVRTLTNLIHHDQALSQRVIDELIRMRLLSTWRDEETVLEKIEIIHDALLREWRLLRDWMAESRIFLAWRDGLETQIRKWEESNKEDGALLQGLALIEAEGWKEIRESDLSNSERNYISCSISLREQEQKEKEYTQRQLKQRAEAILAAYAKLEKLDKNKDDFIQVAAHELRTPLTVIKGYMGMVRSAPAVQSDPSLVQAMDGVMQGTNRLQQIVNSMLDVARLESQTLTPNTETVILDPLLRVIQNVYLKDLTQRELTFEIDPTVDSAPPLLADPELLQKAIDNVIVNAIKFTPDGGAIFISAHSVTVDAREFCEIRIRDTGIGIDASNHTIIFEKLYQLGKVGLHVSGRTSFKGGGPGLGLAIAAGIVRAHRGRIWVESPGHDEEKLLGSTFFIQIPTAK